VRLHFSTLCKPEEAMGLKQALIGALWLVCVVASGISFSGAGYAQDPKVKSAMEILKSKAEKLGAPKIQGTDTVAGKEVPAIYFGSTKQNNDFTMVDEVAREAGGTATIFVKSGDDFIRVATNVKEGRRIARDWHDARPERQGDRSSPEERGLLRGRRHPG
jgi:hypothetical protein